jgi:hypothetical protein
MANKVFEIGITTTVLAGGTITVPSTEGALGSISRTVISGGTPVAVVISETGTTGNITTVAAGYCSLNGSRQYLFLGDDVYPYQVVEVEATSLQDRSTRSAAFAGLPGVQ